MRRNILIGTVKTGTVKTFKLLAQYFCYTTKNTIILLHYQELLLIKQVTNKKSDILHKFLIRQVVKLK